MQDFLRLHVQGNEGILVRLFEFRVACGVDHPFVAFLFGVHGAGNLKAVLVGIGIVHLVALGQLIAILELDADHGTVLALIGIQDAGRAAHTHGQVGGVLVVFGDGGGVIAAADVLVVLVLGGLVVLGVALGVQRGGGHVLDAPQLTGVHGHIAADLQLAAIADAGFGLGVEHGDGNAARDAHVLGARAGDGLRIDHMAGGALLLGLQLHAQRAGQPTDGLVAQLDGDVLRRAAQSR